MFDPNVIGDGVFLSDVSPPSVGRVLPGNYDYYNTGSDLTVV